MINVGVNQLSSPDPNLQQFKVSDVRKNPLYSEDSSAGDLALVRLSGSVTLSSTAKPIALPSTNVQFPVGIKCFVTGWGNIHQGVSLPSPMTLQVGQVELIGRKTCNCLYHIKPSMTTLGYIQDDMVCAGSAAGTVDACQ
ncbi:hypothetical protein FKM82_028175, partial [Ascaphus truei]